MSVIPETGLPEGQLPASHQPGGRLMLYPHHLARKGLIQEPNERSRLAEEIRIIKQRLSRRLRGLGGPGVARQGEEGPIPGTILISSAEPGEGKSTMAANLALALSLEGAPVVLVDCDIVNPTLGSLLGVEPTGGVIDLLSEPERPVDSVALTTDGDRLVFIPAGREPTIDAGLLANGAARGLLSRLTTRWPDRLILVDAPPLLAATEASALAEHVYMTLMVVEANRTSEGKLRSAIDLLEFCPEVCLILNKAPHQHIGNRLGDYYGAWMPETGRQRGDAGREPVRP